MTNTDTNECMVTKTQTVKNSASKLDDWFSDVGSMDLKNDQS